MWTDEGLKGLCQAFFEETEGLLTWRWDDTFSAALAHFSVNDKDRVLPVLGRFMGATWDGSEIQKAPEIVIRLAQNMGGLRPGQLLFTTDAEKNVFIFGAWWPWQDGATISLRVAPCWEALSDSEAEDLLESFRACFEKGL